MKFLFLLLCVAAQANANGISSTGTRGGGDSVNGGSGRRLLDIGEREDFDDSITDLKFSYAYKIAFAHNDFPNQGNPAIIPNAIFREMVDLCIGSQVDQQTLAGLEAKYAGQPLDWRWSLQPLPRIHDEGPIQVESISTERQLAIQENGSVTVYRPDYALLSSIDQSALMVHEGILCAVFRLAPETLKPNGTAPIRKLVNAIYQLAYSFSFIDLHFLEQAEVPLVADPALLNAIADAYQQLGIPKEEILADRLQRKP